MSIVLYLVSFFLFVLGLIGIARSILMFLRGQHRTSIEAIWMGFCIFMSLLVIGVSIVFGYLSRSQS